MKTITNATLYRCEYCNKLYQVGAACKLHEIRCVKNPENISACHCCDFITTRKKSISYDNGYIDVDIERDTFFCSKKNIGLYPPKAFHKGIVAKYPDSFEGEEMMPKQCDLYEFNPGF